MIQFNRHLQPAQGSDLPSMDEEERRASASAVCAASGILRRTGHTLACLSIGAAPGENCLLWDRAFEHDAVASRALGSPTSPALRDLKVLSDALAALSPLLLRRWPAFARPRQLGLVTDGCGLGFSPDDPWPMASGWVWRQCEGAAAFTAILPFPRLGAWQRLVGGSSGGRAH